MFKIIEGGTNMRKRLLSLFVCLCLLVTITSGCQSPKEDSNSTKADMGEVGTKYKEEIIVGIAKDTDSIFPLQSASTIEGQMIFYSTHNTLVDKEVEGSEIVSDLAKTFEQVEPGIYKFKLHENVHFHNGELMTAKDVKFTYDRAMEGKQATRLSMVKEVKVVDDFTVQIELKSPFQDFYYNLAQPNLSIVSEKAVTEMGDEGEKIGTGAYIIEDWSPGEYTKLIRNDDYFGEAPKTERLTFKVISEDSARIIALETGEIDVCYSPSSIDLNHIAESKDLDLVVKNGLITYYIAMNTQRKPFDNELVRQAIASVVNKDECIAVAFGGNATIAENIMPPDVPLYSDVPGIAYDIERAKELLVEAGYPDGFQMELAGVTDIHMDIAQVVQANLSQIGIEAKLSKLDNSTMLEMTVQGTHQAAVMNYSNGSGPDGSITPPFASHGGSNRSKVNDPYIDEMALKAGAEMNVEARVSMYNEMNRHITNKAYWVPIAIPQVFVGIKANLKGALYASTTRHDFTYSYIEVN